MHNADILYDSAYYRDMPGAPSSYKGAADFPFPTYDLGGSGSIGAKGVGKGNLQKFNMFKC